MKKRITQYLNNANTLNEIAGLLVKLLTEIKNEGNNSIGYVSGMITSEGLENVEKNLKRLDDYTQKIKQEYKFPIFSQNDIFTDEVYKIIKQSGATHTDFEEFYQIVHGSGLVTHMFMTPKWELSKGAKDEYKTAQRCGIKVVFV